MHPLSRVSSSSPAPDHLENDSDVDSLMSLPLHLGELNIDGIRALLGEGDAVMAGTNSVQEISEELEGAK